MQTRCLLENNSAQQITESDFVSVHIYVRMATHQNLYTGSVKACQGECASPGGGEITEERHGAAGCQSKDLYRAVAAAETDIGRHGMHDKSQWTGGTRLKKQENTQNKTEGGCANQGLRFIFYSLKTQSKYLYNSICKLKQAVFLTEEK